MAVEPLPTSIDDRVATIELEQAGRPVVVLDHDLIQRLDAALDALPADTRGLVLASASERAFVAGADLSSIRDFPDDRLHAYLQDGARVFGRLATLPCPTAAAINGAALGGGLELAMHCDALIASPSPVGKPYPIGLPESGLSICPGWGGTNLLPARMDAADAIRRTAEGTPMTFDEARAAGLFDVVADDPATLRAAAGEWVRSTTEPGRGGRDGSPLRWIGRTDIASSVLAALDRVHTELPQTESAAAVADCVDVGLASGWQAALSREREHLVRLRRTEAGAAAIAAFFEKSRKT